MGNSMKKITLLLVIFFTFLFSTISWGEWKFVTETINGSKYYYEKDRVRKSRKYLYFSILTDYIKPKRGVLSYTTYTQLKYSILRFKNWKYQWYDNSMGEG